MQDTYETDRLILKVLHPSSARLVLDYYLRNIKFPAGWEPVKGGDFYTLPFQADVLANDLENIENGGALRLWLFKRDDPERVIGMVGFNNIVRGAFLSCFLSYKLDQGETGLGYMTEAVKKGIGVMFGAYGLHRVEANIMPGNTRSLRLVERLGFYNEGLARRYLKINGRWEDHIHMVLLNDAL